MPVCRKKADGPRWGHLVQDHHRDAVAREGDAVHHRRVEEAVRSPPGAPATGDCIARGDVTQELQRHHTAQSYPTGGGGSGSSPDATQMCTPRATAVSIVRRSIPPMTRAEDSPTHFTSGRSTCGPAGGVAVLMGRDGWQLGDPSTKKGSQNTSRS